MSNEQGKISGYRVLSQHEVDMINRVKQAGVDVGELVADLAEIEGIDQRCLAIAKTDLQTGFMFLTRSIAKPGGF